MEILGEPNSQQLGEIIVCVGLASNLSALRALCVEGIQRGHMSLHARNLALASGVPSELVEEAVRFMRNRGKIRKETAIEFLRAYSIYREVRMHHTVPST
jgi:hydroxymethylglutaryl-CoA synthase